MTKCKVFRSAPLLVILLLSTGCGADPEKAGDECDPDDGCPDNMVCKPLGGEDVCQVPSGGVCEPTGTDYCVDAAVCAADGKGGGRCGIAEGDVCDPLAPTCAGNLACAELVDGGHSCHLPVLIQGMVFDAVTTAGIRDAHVIALDDRATALTDVAISNEQGNYTLDVPVARNADGSPITTVIVTLRAAARDYQTFPGGLRTALPIRSSEALATDTGWIVESALTDIALIGLPEDQRGRATISGAVQADDRSAGVLVVAEAAAEGAPTAVSDRDGTFTVFNVPDGTYTVRGYAAGLQLQPVDTTVAGANISGVNLLPSDAALGIIAGRVEIVNAPGGAMTSVVLVPQATFDATFARGEVPRGLRTPLSGPPTVAGDFTIVDVPSGRYTVLAAFENDELVRDPDQNIAGTQIVTVEMPLPGQRVDLAQSFKITEALDVIGPGTEEPEAVSGNVTLSWQDDSGEEWYEVVVFNALGERVWCRSDQLTGCDGPRLEGVSGSTTVSVPYDGPLESGMYYQFRATSWRSTAAGATAMSSTEDLRGVFFVASE
jgi:hypothetical protein